MGVGISSSVSDGKALSSLEYFCMNCAHNSVFLTSLDIPIITGMSSSIIYYQFIA